MGRKTSVNVSWTELADRCTPMDGEASQQIAKPKSTNETKASDRVTVRGLYAMLKKQEFRCALSGMELTTENVSIDHIVPLSDGGMHVMGNVQLLDKVVNVMKHTMGQEEFVRICGLISQWNA